MYAKEKAARKVQKNNNKTGRKQIKIKIKN